MKTLIRATYLLVLGLLAACGGTPGGSAPLETQATTLRVTTTADEFNNDGDCSLREAIVAANEGRQVDACAGGSGTQTIVLQEKTYPLRTQHEQVEDYDYIKSTLPVVTGEVVLEGNGATLTGTGRNLNLLTVGFEGRFTANSLTIADGKTHSGSTAAVKNMGELYGEYLTFKGNRAYETGRSGAAALYNGGNLRLTHCKFMNNHSDQGAGAVYSAISSIYQEDYYRIPEFKRPRAYFDQCVFEGNTTNTGVAAIHNTGYGRMFVERSAVVKNEVKQYVDSSDPSEFIPAIIKNDSLYISRDQNSERPALFLENVTLSLSVGQVYNAFANFTKAQIMHSTIFKNRSNINANTVRGIFHSHDGERLEIGHTVVADHEPRNVQKGSTWGDCNRSNSITSLGYNFESDGTCKFGATGDIHERKLWAVLLPLADNGGFAPTHELVPAWSKLWNAGATSENTNHGTDGRLDKRINGKEVDIGAVETCDDFAIFWLLIIPIPYCVEEQEVLKLEIPLNVELSEATFDAELLEMFQAPCERCTLGIGMTEAGVLRFALEEEAFHQADIEAVRLYSAEGNVIAEGERGLEVELKAGRYYLDISGEGKEGVKLPARAVIEPR